MTTKVTQGESNLLKFNYTDDPNKNKDSNIFTSIKVIKPVNTEF